MNPIVASVVFLFVVGLPWGLLLTRGLILGVVTAPLWTGLVSTLAAVLSLLTRTALQPWLISVALVGWFVFAWVALKNRRVTIGETHWRLMLGVAPAAFLSLLSLRLAPVGWDARSYWWLHAVWFYRGGAEAVTAMGNPAFDFANINRPPFSPATVAASWMAAGGVDYKVAQVVSAVLTVSALVCLAILIRKFKDYGGELLVVLTLTAVVFGVQAFAGEGATNGYNDLLWSASLAGAALCLFDGRTDFRALGIGLLTTATLSKPEGLLAGIGLLAVLTIFRKRANFPLWPPALGVMMGLIWVATSSLVGNQSTQMDFQFATRLDFPVAIRRIGLTLEYFWRAGGWVIVAGYLLLAISYKQMRSKPGQTAMMLGLVSVLYLLSLGAVYVLLSPNLERLLIASAGRTLTLPRLMSVVIAAWIFIDIARKEFVLGTRAVPAPVTGP